MNTPTLFYAKVRMASNATTVPRTECHPYLLKVKDVARQMDIDLDNGLTATRVSEIQKEHGPNELIGGGEKPWWKILLKQCANAMSLVSVRSS